MLYIFAVFEAYYRPAAVRRLFCLDCKNQLEGGDLVTATGDSLDARALDDYLGSKLPG